MIRNSNLLAAAVALAIVVAGCDSTEVHRSLAPVIGERNASLLAAGTRELNALQLSAKDEDTIGQSVAVGLTNRYPLAASTDLQRYVNLVGLTVANGSPNPGGNWVFGVVESPDVNAFSGPNGYVFITRGLLVRVQDEAELAGVLAHEIAHVCNHDGLKQVQANEQKGALVQAMQASGDSRLGQLSAMADNGLDVVTRQGYDQPQEFKADDDGVRIMTAAGYNARSYLAFLQRLQTQGAASRGGQIMSTHPGIAQRIARVTDELRTVPPGGATLADRFRTRTAGAR
jgi:beta-barrel assembly-enhancing protease